MIYFNSIRHYAKEKQVNWRTAKSRLKEWTVIEFTFKRTKVYIEKEEIVRYILSRYTSSEAQNNHIIKQEKVK